MPHKFRSLLFSTHHAKVVFMLVVTLAGTSASGFALTTAYKPTPKSELPAPLRTAVPSPTKTTAPKSTSTTSAAPPTATIEATPPTTTTSVPTPKVATNPAASPAAVASTGTAPGTGASGLTTTSGSPPPAVSPSPDTDTSGSQSTPAPTCTNTSAAYDSTNWSGYVKSGCTFTDISAAWTIPTPTGSSTETTADAAWIGIGGLSTSDLIQVGTEDTVDTDGTINAAVFYELLPAAAVYPASIPVSPGDKVSAALHEIDPGLNQWLISITDTTTGQTFSSSVQYVSGNASAEWIEEDPSYTGGTLVPFDNFGSVTFTGASDTGNGAVGNLSDASTITIVNHRQIIAQPGAVSGQNSDTFTVTRASTSGT